MIDYIIVGIIVLLLVAIIANGIRKRRNGESGCGCSGCGSCPSQSSCHDELKKQF